MLEGTAYSLAQCSTPFGITEVGILAQCRPPGQYPVLNAFRHHRGGHLVAVGELLRGLGCSTPFGITEVGMPRYRHQPRIVLVLNAFRHHRGGHTLRRHHSHAQARAQRLSASQRWAFARVDDGLAVLQCSTPFGITEVGISLTAREPVRWPQCSTPFGITEVGIGRGAIPGPRLHRVLNAFRHHRGGHALQADGWWLRSECSTPFGITEVGIRAKHRLVAIVEVLNAFRHHRGGHSTPLRG